MKEKFLYKSKLDFFQTQKGITIINKSIVDFLMNQLNLIELRSPMYFYELEKNFDRNDFSISRKISFDSITDYNVYEIFNNYDNWMYDNLVNLEIKNNNGIFSNLRYILRDKQKIGISSFEQNEILIFFRFDNLDLINEKIINIMKNFYLNLIAIKRDLNFKYKSLETNLENKILLINLNDSNLKLNEKNINELKNFNLQKNNWNIFQFQKENDKKLQFTISVYMDKINEYVDILKVKIKNEEKINYFKIKINLDFIYMVLLEKLFVYEVQSNINSKKINKLLTENKINHI